MPDRRVHVRLHNGGEVVRYERAGRWYLEWPNSKLIPAKRLTLDEAVRYAVSDHTTYMPGVLGGRMFDARVARATERTQKP